MMSSPDSNPPSLPIKCRIRLRQALDKYFLHLLLDLPALVLRFPQLCEDLMTRDEGSMQIPMMMAERILYLDTETLGRFSLESHH